MVGHCSNECKKSKSKIKYGDTIDYKKNYFDMLQQKDKASIFEERDWAAEVDNSDDEEYVNLTLMTNTNDQEANSSSKGEIYQEQSL